MTQREQFLSQMGSSPCGQVPNWEFGFWNTTLSVWHEQGLPREIVTADQAYEGFGIEDPHFGHGFFLPSANLRLAPPFSERSLGFIDGIETRVDGDGVTYAEMAEGQNTIPHYLDYPVKTRADWDARYKPRLDPDTASRWPEMDWDRIRSDYAASGKPVCLYLDSYMGYPRNLMGFEAFAMLAYDDPDLFEDMVETLTRIKHRRIDSLVGRIQVDLVHYWEDICYNAGPMLSPETFRKIVAPRMKGVNDRLRRELGAKFISVDCDGNFSALLDDWVDTGVNVLMPCEVDAGMDVLALQKSHGDRCGFLGGIQKKALIEGPAAIDEELRRVLPAVRRGGYIPHLDHGCPSNVPLANYQHYLRGKRDILGCI
jgi:uroporphyrinogen decarboxylase